MFTNTILFSEAAQYKLKHGVYCKAPYQSKDYDDFWNEQDKRCKYGYSVGGTRITGYHYWFLNFKQLEIVENPHARASKKILSFPRFWQVHYEFFHALEKAEDAGKHFIILKPRGSGFSEIASAMATRDYTLYPGSKSFFFAFDRGYLTKDGVLTKCWDHLEYLNQNTERAYRHLRQVKNQDLHKRASWLDSKGEEKGHKSEIIGRIIDNPRKVRGARTGSKGKVYFEEGGSFPDLESAVTTTRPLVEQGGVATGQIVVWGTGGEDGKGIEGLERIFSDPETYNFYAFKNIWDENMADQSCGYFFPVTHAMDRFMDSNGNYLEDEAWEFQKAERAKIRKSKPQAEDKYIAEYPISPQEALIRARQNIFPVAELQRQLLHVQTDKAIQGFLKHGDLYRDIDGKAKFRINPKARPLVEWPLNDVDDKDGCITILETPYKDQMGIVPDGLYYILLDAYYLDQSEYSDSVGAAYVYKSINNVSPTEDDLFVGWYVGRPKTLDIFYKNLFLLAEYYNATIQSEISGGGKGVYDYAKAKRLLHRLEKEPHLIFTQDNPRKEASRSYFMKMPNDRVPLAHTYLAEWLLQERSISEEGTVLNLHRVYDEGLLRELIKHNDQGNFDRVSAARLTPFMIKEKVEERVMAYERSSNSFWDRDFFADSQHYDSSFNLPVAVVGMAEDQDPEYPDKDDPYTDWMEEVADIRE